MIESHGGTVEKFIGDAVVGVFGVPAVHEDDPERAVRAGLRIVEATRGHDLVPTARPLKPASASTPARPSCASTSAPGSGAGFLTGDAVNTAARLQAAAPRRRRRRRPDSPALTSGVIVYEELPPVVAKGKAEPVARVARRRPVARTGLRTSGLTTTPFLGREKSLHSLQSALREDAQSSRGHVVLLVGEPGIGKSRLVLEFARSLDERPEMVTWRLGRCLPYGEGVTFWPMGEIVKAHAGILDSDDVATVESKLDCVLPEGEDSSRGCINVCAPCSASRRRRPHARRTSPPGSASSS